MTGNALLTLNIISLEQNTSLADGGPMPNSPSSMVNQYRLEEDEEQQDASAKDLFITVDNPESHVTAIETFIMYRVVTKVSQEALRVQWVVVLN